MSKDIEPIQEHLTLYEKIKRYFKQKTYKCKVEKRKTIKIKIRDFEIKKYRIWLNNANENIIINDIISFRKEK